jgi:hypothetical protein
MIYLRQCVLIRLETLKETAERLTLVCNQDTYHFTVTSTCERSRITFKSKMRSYHSGDYEETIFRNVMLCSPLEVNQRFK